MRNILDPANNWIGTPGSAQVFGNKRPVALDDSLTVQKDSGPVTITVLANDFDPEGRALTLVSAVAALGTAVAEANNTVTYTPPAGISGADTVVYEVADDLGQRDAAQINVIIFEPELAITVQGDNTMVVNAGTGAIDITVTQPSIFAGTYSKDIADLVSGPVNLVAPAISGTPEAGQVLTAANGLWIYGTGAGSPIQTWQWRRAGMDISGAVSATYTVQAGDVGPGLSVAEIMTDGNGTRSAISAAVGTDFQPSDDAQLLGWWDASDAATIIETAGVVSNWIDKAGGPALGPDSAPQRPDTGTRLLNGLNVLDFNNAHLAASRTFPTSGDVAFHMVLEIDSISNAFEAILAVEAANDFQIDANAATQFDGRLNASGIATTTGLSGGPFSGSQILSVILDQTGTATIEVFIGGISRGSTAYAMSLDQSAALHVMSNRSKNAWINGAVAELIVTGDTTNRDQYHAYLDTKWGES